MSLDPQNIVTLVVTASVFGLVLSLWSLGVLLWSRRRSVHEAKVGKRLRTVEQGSDEKRVLRLWHDGREATTAVSTAAPRKSLLRRLDQIFEDAGWNGEVRTLVLAMLGMTSMSCVALSLVLMDSAIVGAGIAGTLILIFWTYLKYRISRRTALFETQLVEALELAARSLRAGHPLVGAFKLISEEFPAPVGSVFAQVCQQQELGVGLGDAVCQAAAASSSGDMRLFATSVVIQLRTGGNLADMMERVAAVIRDRMRLHRRIRILTAQTQFSKRILLFLPFVIFMLLNALNPDYMDPLYTTANGRFLLGMGALALVLGAWSMNRLAVLRY